VIETCVSDDGILRSKVGTAVAVIFEPQSRDTDLFFNDEKITRGVELDATG
jgi:hypothetical protein